MSAGITAQLLTYPLDTVSARMKINLGARQYKSVPHALVEIGRKDGLVALYRGSVPTLCGSVPYAGIEFAIYETLKAQTFTPKRPDAPDQPTAPAKMVCGAVAGITGQTFTYPFDVVRRRMQVQAMAVGAGGTLRKFSGMREAFTQTVRNEGFWALYRGLLPNYCKVAPMVGISFLTYETVSGWLADLSQS